MWSLLPLRGPPWNCTPVASIAKHDTLCWLPSLLYLSHSLPCEASWGHLPDKSLAFNSVSGSTYAGPQIQLSRWLATCFKPHGLEGPLLSFKFHMGNLGLHLRLKGEAQCRTVQDYQGWRRWGSRPWQTASLHHHPNIEQYSWHLTAATCITWF